MASKRSIGMIQVHLAVLLFGLAGLFGKILLLPALIIVLGRVFFASLTLASILYFRGKKSFSFPKELLFFLLGLGLLLAFHWFAFFRAIQLTTVALGLITYATFPVFTALMEPLFFREKIAWQNIGLAIIAAFGVYLAASEKGMADNNLLAGVTWGVLSGFSFGLLTLGNRQVLKRMPALKLTFYQDLFACIFLMPFYFLLDFDINYKDWIALVLLGTVFTALAHFLFIASLKTIKAQIASIISSLEPVYGVLFAALLINEFPGIKTIAGLLITLLVVWYISFRKNGAS